MEPADVINWKKKVIFGHLVANHLSDCQFDEDGWQYLLDHIGLSSPDTANKFYQETKENSHVTVLLLRSLEVLSDPQLAKEILCRWVESGHCHFVRDSYDDDIRTFINQLRVEGHAQ